MHDEKIAARALAANKDELHELESALRRCLGGDGGGEGEEGVRFALGLESGVAVTVLASDKSATDL